MTNSTIPDAWLQALVDEKVAKLNQEAMKDFVTVEKKVFDVLQKNNVYLMEELEEARSQLDKARLALARIYEIVDHEYDWGGEYCIGEISGDNLKEVAGIIKEYGV